MKRLFSLFLLTLFGCGGGSTPEPVNPTPVQTNSRPVSVLAESANVVTGEVVLVDASGSSDPDGDELTYEFTVTSAPDNSTITLNTVSSQTSSSYNFTPDVDGTYRIRLTVYDGELRSSAVSITIDASTPNRAPIAITASNLETLVESTIILDASGSTDADNDALSYTWSFVSVPDGSAFSPSNPTTTESNRINFTPDVVGTYELTLIVSDGELSSDAVPLTIVVTTPNQPPVLTIDTSNESYELMQLDLAFTVSDDESLDLLNITVDGDDAELFLIENNAIYFNIIPDYETPSDDNQDNVYSFVLNVSDGELSVSEQITVTVLNVNEYTDDTSLPTYASGNFTRFITQDVDSGEEGTLTMSFAENNNTDGFLPPLTQGEVALLWNWVFDGAESLIFGVIQNQPTDSQNGPLREYFYREFEGETYCSNYVSEVCEPIEVLINNFGLGYSISQNAFNYYQDSEYASSRDFYSLNTLLTLTNDDDGIFISRLGNNEAYDVIAVNYERIFNNSTSTGLDSISGVLYIYPPLGIVGGVLSIDSASYFDSDYNIRFHIDNTNITSNP